MFGSGVGIPTATFAIAVAVPGAMPTTSAGWMMSTMATVLTAGSTV